MGQPDIQAKLIYSVIAVFFAVSVSWPLPAVADELRIAVGTTALENIFSKIKGPFENLTGIKLIYDPRGLGSDEVFRQVDQGLAEGGAGAIPIDDWLELMKQEHYPVPDPTVFKWRTIGGDRIHVFLNKELKIKALQIDKIRAIFKGKARNWKELGGPDQPITIVLTHRLVATQQYFRKKILDGAPFPAGEVKMADSADEMRKMIALTPGAVGIGPVSLADNTVDSPDIPPITRPLPFITKGRPSPNVEKLLEFIVKEGDRYGVAR